jgi:hypothetical protein
MRIVIGSLDDIATFKDESAKADIVLNFAHSDHPPSSEAIMRGANRHTGTKPIFVIHTSGMGILTWKTVETNTYGELEDKVYGKYLIYHKKVTIFLIYHTFFWPLSHIP